MTFRNIPAGLAQPGDQDAIVPDWERRFRAAVGSLPDWALDVPERLIYTSNASGTWQLWAWDAARGEHTRVSDHPTGVVDAGISPDGSLLVWFEDRRGDEVGRWLARPFAGGPVAPLLTDVAPAWTVGLALGPARLVVAGTADRGGFSVRTGTAGGSSREIYRHEQTVQLGGLARDGSLVVIEHAEHGDNLHPALLALDPASGARIAELWDGPGFGLGFGSFSPVRGDLRAVVTQERHGRRAPAIWDPGSGAREDLELGLPGEVLVADWWPDGAAVLVVHTYRGRDELYRYRLADAAVERLEHPPGSISGASVRPDGSVWYRWSSGAAPPAVLQARAGAAGGVVLAPPGPPAPPGAPYRDWSFRNSAGDEVHGFLVPPPGNAPFPTVLLVHGGPNAHDADAFQPQVQAFVDHGYAVGLVNYRGSTGYGKRWQDALEGDPGRPEVEDVVAGRDDLLRRGIADPHRVVIAGGSWGGYITLLAIGTVPAGWRAAVAIVPVADYVAAYEEESEQLQAFDRTLFGGGPLEVPELFRERSPITYAAAVRTPVLLMVGDNDTRCPLRQVLHYAEELATVGKPYRLDRFDAGHGALVIDERVRQMRVVLDFLAETVGSGSAAGGISPRSGATGQPT